MSRFLRKSIYNDRSELYKRSEKTYIGELTLLIKFFLQYKYKEILEFSVLRSKFLSALTLLYALEVLGHAAKKTDFLAPLTNQPICAFGAHTNGGYQLRRYSGINR